MAMNLVSSNGISGVQDAASGLIALGSTNLAFVSNNAAGNLIIAAIRVTSGSSSTPTDSRNSYNIAVANAQIGGATAHLSVYYAYNIGAGANTVSFTSSGTFVRAFIFEYSGILSTADPLDKTHSNKGTNNTPSSGAVATTSQNIELAFGLLGSSDTVTTPTAGSGWTLELNTSGSAVASEDQILTTTGTPNATWGSLTGGPDWASIIATFKAPLAVNKNLLMLMGCGT